MEKALQARPDPNGNLNEVRAYLLQNEADGKATVLTKLNFQDESNVTGNMGFTQFFSIEVRPSAVAKPILTGFSRYSAVDFTPDGKKLVVTADIDTLEHPDRSRESEIYVADADGKI